MAESQDSPVPCAEKPASGCPSTPPEQDVHSAIDSSEKTAPGTPPPTDASPRPVHGVKVRHSQYPLLPIEFVQCANKQLPPRQWVLVVVSLLASFLLYALDTTIVATIQPAIVDTYGRVDLVPWLAAAFALASAATTLPWSKAYGTFSAKKLFIGGTALFMGASALCGAAPNIDAFIVGRALAGMGGTGMYMGIMTILSVNTSEQERPRYLSLTGFWWGIGTVLGPVVGGAFAESSATWRCKSWRKLSCA